ncbi:ATP-dependent DNA helicase pif1-like [Gordionus sp. m RMFG-2023]|uniref:ATP-dependent DNA helicase pif1-like n=1 Tax=Gordionus sp. m RMFG-2023 TaxID=3053472 RepID=UPI0031FD9B39
MALMDIENVFLDHGLCCQSFDLPSPTKIPPKQHYDAHVEAADSIERISKLNRLQKYAFDLIIQAIELENIPERYFFVDGPGGSGKTYLYNTLMCYIRAKNQIVLPFATTGIFSILLKGGRTIHSGFKLPVPIFETSTSHMNLHSSLALDIKNSKLIIIDEATMMTKHALRCIDRLLKDIIKNSHPFGGKVILLGGDFRQTLPVVPKGSKVDIIESCIKSSYLWSYFKIIHLIDNMRISSDQVDYNAWLLKIGDGLSRSNSDLPTNSVEIPPYLLENDSLIKCVYGNSIEIADIDSLSTKIILTTKNKIALTLNNDIINIISGPIKHYYSADSIESDNKDDILNFPLELLHSQTPSGMPPHKLTLKVGTIVMLLRNLSPKKGLCNGTRLIIRHLHINFIDAEVLTGTNKGYRVFLPRIDLAPSYHLL